MTTAPDTNPLQAITDKLDEAMGHFHRALASAVVTNANLEEALGVLRWIRANFDAKDMTDAAFRLGVAFKVEAALQRIECEAERRAEIERASQPHAPEVPGEIATDESE